MKSKKLTITLLMAVTSGVLAGGMALRYLGQQPTSLGSQSEAPKGKLVVATRDLPLGSILKAEDVRQIDWPAGPLPAGYSGNAAEVVGHGLISPLLANEPVLKTKLASKESGGGLPIVIPEGMRGVSVKVDEVIGVAGFVLPGTRVDVLVTIQPPQDETRRDPVTRVILQNVQTLAAGQTIQRDAEGKPQTVAVITLLVTPEQAEKLTLAANEGKIQLALRNMMDTSPTETSGIRASSLASNVPGTVARAIPTSGPVAAPRSTRTSTPVVVIPPSNNFTVETYRGGERTLSTFTPRRP